jgi:asparagine synthase (glutamine-hydrolysing)
VCGILGEIRQGIRTDTGTTLRHYGAIARRGPDNGASKCFTCGNCTVSLVHSRLSIIDLSELGNQPMYDELSGWWMIYNGEIYNYLEIRQELTSLGWTFHSTSDTEVLLKAWAQWGIAALPRCNGMFAFAAFNPRSGELWLLRDRFGVKPLVWGRSPDGSVHFSSSVTAVATEAGSDIDIAYCARGVYYKVYETAESASPFRNVRTVPPGGWVRFQISGNDIRVEQGQWYEFKEAVDECIAKIAGTSQEALIDQCRNFLEDAVRLRMRSDVPVAVSLSGGLDSPTIASIAARSVKRIHGFTFGSQLDGASEGPDVHLFSQASAVDVTYVWPRFDRAALGEALERTLAFQEAPFSGTSVIAQNEVYRAVHAAGLKVLLGGQGGDEAFAGYRKFFLVALRDAIHRRGARDVIRVIFSLGAMLRYEVAQAHVYWANRHRYRSKKSPGLLLLDWEPSAEDLLGHAGQTLAERQIADIQRWSLPTLLRYEDRNSMGYGVESRLPFLDYRLVELAVALPLCLKINKGYGKWALRLVSEGLIPDQLRLNRKKRGFDVTQDWVHAGFGQVLRHAILDNRKSLSSHMRRGIDVNLLLSDDALSRNSNLLGEAFMLAWLVNPLRVPGLVNSQRTYDEKESLPLFCGS